MKEETRVIHCRLKDRTIVGCIELLKNSGHDLSTIPMSSIVRDALEGIIDFMIKKGQLLGCTNPTEILNGMYPREKDEEPIDFGFEGLIESLQGGLSEDELVSQLTEEAVRQISDSSKPNVTQEVTVSESVENKKIIKYNLFSMNREKLKDLSKLAPKDRLIQLANEHKDDKVFIAALEVVYSELPISMWGSEVAEMQIKNLQNVHSGK